MIPILIILFLRNFSSNTYSIPILYENGVEDPYQECDFPAGQQHVIPEFSFYAQDSSEIGSQQMKGKLTVMTIITGVKSPWILGKMDYSKPSPQAQEINEELGIEII